MREHFKNICWKLINTYNTHDTAYTKNGGRILTSPKLFCPTWTPNYCNYFSCSYLRITCFHWLHLYLQPLFFLVFPANMFSTPGPQLFVHFLDIQEQLLESRKHSIHPIMNNGTWIRHLKRFWVQGNIRPGAKRWVCGLSPEKQMVVRKVLGKGSENTLEKKCSNSTKVKHSMF